VFQTLKAQYDYIIVDTAPVSLVTDTLLIETRGYFYICGSRQLLKKAHVEYSQQFTKNKNYQTCVCFLMTQTRLKDMLRLWLWSNRKAKPWYKRVIYVDSNDILISNKATKNLFCSLIF
jgi:hypothetical protein